MFSGIVEDVGVLVGRHETGDGRKLQIQTHFPMEEIGDGESIAVNGTCLTVESRDAARNVVGFHTLHQTLRCTNLGDLEIGSKVNLERALCLGDRLGGHLVSGHVDAPAKVISAEDKGEDIIFEIELPEHLKVLMVNKGSIAVDGISLTVADLKEDSFFVHIIPFTIQHTNIQDWKVGHLVNLEMDMVGKFILRKQEVEGGMNAMAPK